MHKTFRKVILVLLVAGSVAIVVDIVYTSLRVKQLGPSLRLQTVTASSSWSPCDQVLYNKVGDTLAVCINGQDTIVAISCDWMKNIPIAQVHRTSAKLDRAMFRIYSTGNIGYGIGIENGDNDHAQVQGLFIQASKIDGFHQRGDTLFIGFHGRDLSLSCDSVTLQSTFHLGSLRQGNIAIYKSTGNTRFRITF